MSTLSPSTSRTALRSRQRDARGFTVTALTTKASSCVGFDLMASISAVCSI
jgi:hypothetical protein